MNEFIKKLVLKEANHIVNAQMPSHLECGEQDAWTENNQNRFQDIAHMNYVAQGTVDTLTADQIDYYSKKIMALVADELHRITYNSNEYLNGLLIDAQDEEARDEYRESLGDPK